MLVAESHFREENSNSTTEPLFALTMKYPWIPPPYTTGVLFPTEDYVYRAVPNIDALACLASLKRGLFANMRSGSPVSSVLVWNKKTK